jgi:hypothetical protein
MRPSVSWLFAVVVLGALASQAAPNKKVALDADDAFAEMDKQFTLRLFDAVTGKPVAGAEVTYAGKTAVSDGEGGVRFPFPAGLTADDAPTEALFRKRGYVTTKLQFRFEAGSLFFNRFSVSPALPPGLVRVVLDWDAAPADLDAHLVKEGAWHISFREMRKFEDLAWLDRDATAGFGPETITVKKFDLSARYRFFVHDFTNRGKAGSDALAVSRAHVRLYTEAGLLKSFAVSPKLVGDRWEVFEIVDGQVVAR